MTLRITHIISSLTIGGAQQLVLDLSRETKAQSHDVRVIGLRPGRMTDEFRRERIPVVELDMGRMASPATLFRLVSLLKQQRPDVVHTHLGRADSYGRLAARLAGVPSIVTTAHNVEKWKDNFPLRWIDARTSQFAHRIIACSERVREHLSEVGAVPMEKMIVIRNGIRLRGWADQPDAVAVAGLRKDLGLGDKDFVMGIIARLEEQKGHAYLFEALAALRAEIPDLRLLVVGEGSLGDSLKHLAASLKLAPNIIFAGARRDMRLVYAALDLVVMPSLWEGLPITLLEAMAAGRPVIATSVGGIPEVIRDQLNGVLVPPKDGAALAGAIQRSYQNRDLLRALAAAGLQTVQSEFSIEVTARKVLEVYQALRRL